jgi:hypothetical protein
MSGVTVLPVWTGTSLVLRTFDDSNLDIMERAHWPADVAAAFKTYTRLQKQLMRQRMRSREDAQLRQLGYGPDGRPLRGRR